MTRTALAANPTTRGKHMQLVRKKETLLRTKAVSKAVSNVAPAHFKGGEDPAADEARVAEHNVELVEVDEQAMAKTSLNKTGRVVSGETPLESPSRSTMQQK